MIFLKAFGAGLAFLLSVSSVMLFTGLTVDSIFHYPPLAAVAVTFAALIAAIVAVAHQEPSCGKHRHGMSLPTPGGRMDRRRAWFQEKPYEIVKKGGKQPPKPPPPPKSQAKPPSEKGKA